ncbi:MAG: toxin [Bacteroidales bacterium]|nr:toxin [Bacteroidales bacterium]
MARNDATKEQVEAFLNEFIPKSKIFGLTFDTVKEENLQTMLELELYGDKRKELIYKLKPEDYYQGPDSNDYDSTEGDVWMFGIGVRKNGKGKTYPVYIKIYITKICNAPNYCISFHIAKYPMSFPFKDSI